MAADLWPRKGNIIGRFKSSSISVVLQQCRNQVNFQRKDSGIISKVSLHFLKGRKCSLKPGFHMLVTVGEASPRQARGHIGDSCVKWKHFLNDVADQTGTVRGRIERVEMSLGPGFHMIISVIVSICRRLIGDMSPMYRIWSPTVTIIWKPGFMNRQHS